jgi:hypothetical protein
MRQQFSCERLRQQDRLQHNQGGPHTHTLCRQGAPCGRASRSRYCPISANPVCLFEWWSGWAWALLQVWQLILLQKRKMMLLRE